MRDHAAVVIVAELEDIRKWWKMSVIEMLPNLI